MFFFWVRRLCTKDGYNSRGPSTNVSLLQETCFPTWEGWCIVSVVSDDTVHGRHPAAVAPVNNFVDFTRWWQLKYFVCSPPKLGKVSNFTNIFQMGWNHQPDDDTMLQGLSYIPRWFLCPKCSGDLSKAGFETLNRWKVHPTSRSKFSDMSSWFHWAVPPGSVT